MHIAKITSKGQITLPKTIREYLLLKQGDRIEFFINPDGKVTLWPVTADVRELKGMIPGPGHPVSIGDMNRAIAEEGGKS